MTVRRLALYATALVVGFAVGFTLRYGQLTVERREYEQIIDDLTNARLWEAARLGDGDDPVTLLRQQGGWQ